MTEKIYVCLFMLCVVLCQGITGVSSEDVGGSNSLIRRKRVINLQPGGDVPLEAGVAPFVVNIRHSPYNITICVGTILSRRTVITATDRVAHLDVGSIQILVGAVYTYRGEHHNVIAKHMHFGNHPHDPRDGIALLTVQQAFVFNRVTSPIPLHTGPLLAGTPATIFGWGHNPTAPRGTNYRSKLRSITLPIMSHRDCVNIYKNRAEITDKDICTYDPLKRCGHTDYGAPLVVDNQLAGIYLWTGRIPSHVNPDVFLIIQHMDYSQWIRSTIVHDV